MKVAFSMWTFAMYFLFQVIHTTHSSIHNKSPKKFLSYFLFNVILVPPVSAGQNFRMTFSTSYYTLGAFPRGSKKLYNIYALLV